MKYRQQSDPHERTTIDCSQPVIVRPEFGPETDLKRIIGRHGIISNRQEHTRISEVDYTQDLTTAFQRIERAYDAFSKLPADVHAKYRTPFELWRAYQNGDLDAPQTNSDNPSEPTTEGTT